jgi:hypothetical protein
MENLKWTLNNQLTCLFKLLKRGLSEADLTKIHSILLSYSKLLQNSNLILSTQIDPKSTLCVYCQCDLLSLSSKPTKLSCDHSICSPDCFQALINNTYGRASLSEIVLFCPSERCGKVIAQDIVDSLSDRIHSCSGFFFNCAICKHVKDLEESISLLCSHSFCKKCFRAYLQVCKTTSFTCHTCNAPIHKAIVDAWLNN